MLRIHITYELVLGAGLAALLAFIMPQSVALPFQCLAAALLAGMLVHFKTVGPRIHRSAIEQALTGILLVVAFVVALPVFLSALLSALVAYFAVGHLR